MTRQTLCAVFTLCFATASHAVPLSPESLERLRQSGGLAAHVASQRQATEAGFHQNGPNLLPSLRSQHRDDPDEINFNFPVILVDFEDNEADQETNSPDHFEELIFSEGQLETGSVRDWYEETTYGEVGVEGEVSDWVRASEAYDYFVDGQNGYSQNYPQNVWGLVNDAVGQADDQIDYSEFDGDDDGYVDVVMIVHAGPGAEQNAGDRDMIHSHSGATPIVMRLDGVRIRRYVIVPENALIGVCAHELAHALLGLPDLYDRDYSSRGLGAFSVMAEGSWGDGGRRPVHFDAWSKVTLGFVEPEVPTENIEELTFPPVASDPVIYKLWTNGEAENEYFLVENRQPIGFDGILPRGLCVYHVDDDMREEQNDNEWYPEHEDEGHYLVALEQADGLFELEQDENSDDADQFPGSRNVRNFTSGTTPNSRSYAGGQTFVAITDITLDDEEITCGIEVVEGEVETQTGEIAYDDGQPVRLNAPMANYWSKTTFTVQGVFILAGVRIMPFNRGPNFNTPCQIRIYAEEGGHNLGDLLYQTSIQSLPAFDMNDMQGNWLTVAIPEDDRPTFEPNQNFTVMYGAAPGGAFNPNDIREGQGWWNLGDNADNNGRSFGYSGNNPADSHGSWGRFGFDLMIRAVGEGDEPEIECDADEIDFGRSRLNADVERNLVVTNTGESPLSLLSLSLTGADANQFGIIDGGGAGNLNPNAERAVRVRFRPTSAGPKECQLRIVSTDLDESPLLIEVAGIGSALPIITEPSASILISINLAEGDTVSLGFRARDDDGGELAWTLPARGGLPDRAEFTDHQDGSATLDWIVGFNEGGRYLATFVVTDSENQTDQIRINLVVANVNQPPIKVLQPADTTLAEDPGRTVIYSLNDIFSDPDGDELQFSFECLVAALHAQFEQNDLTITPEDNFNLPEGTQITLTARDPAEETITASFTLRVSPVNDAPVEFALTSPADSARIEGIRTGFSWEASSDVEGDRVTYNFYLRIGAADPETLFYEGIEGQEYSLSEVDSASIADMGIDLVTAGEWWVEASDGEVVTESSTRRIIQILPLSIASEQVVPERFEVGRAYPNPFNSSVNIELLLPSASHLKVDLFDMEGRCVRRLIQRTVSEGRLTLSWNGEDDEGKVLPSGVYLIRTASGSELNQQKVVLLR